VNARSQFYEEAAISDADLEPYREMVNPGRNVVSISSFAPEVVKLMSGQVDEGDPLPFPKTHRDFRFRPGETTLWFGINGHGKSALTSQVALCLAIHGRKSCLASFEMPPVRTVQRMVLQAALTPKPAIDFTVKFFSGMAGRIYVYDKTGNIDKNLMFAAMRYAAHEKGVTHFFVDSLMKCVRGEDDYNGQKDFVCDLMAVGRELNIHVHLIHHVRKGADEKGIPSKFDAKGTGAVTDQVDNVLCVWRNKAKEQDDEKALEMGAALTAEGPDFLLICDKQRHGNWEGRWALWGDRQTWHFRESRQPAMGYTIPEYKQKQEEPGANG
jgi:twinkle protein